MNFKKVKYRDLDLTHEGVRFVGTLKRVNIDFLNLTGTINGIIKSQCDRCLEEFDLKIDEDLDLKLYRGVYRGEDEVIEIHSEKIDFTEILASELELLKSDYHLCKNCENIEEFEQEF